MYKYGEENYKMKSVGIITIQKPPENYGAALQAYALWSFIEKRGYDCKVIDLLRPWHPSYKYSNRDPKITKSLKSKIIRCFWEKRASRRMLKSIRNIQFEKFNNKIKYTCQFYSIDDLYENPPYFDYYISGSDQIWNPNMNVVNEPYFLSFAKDGSKKLSYASSFAVKDLSPNISEQYIQWLKSYSFISVREEDGLEIIKRMGLKQPAQVVLDPIFLLEVQEWKSIAKVIPDSEPYIFVYLLHSNETINKYVFNLAKKKHYNVKIVVSDTTATIPQGFQSLMDIGPEEWIGCIQNAKIVITDSFHCTAFSLLLEKTFFTITTNISVSSRMSNMLEKFEISDHLIDINNLESSVLVFAEIDYKPINSLIKKEREKSIDFLLNALK